MNKILFRIFILCFVLSVFLVDSLYADEVHLSNGDRITGSIVSKDDTTVTIATEALGQVIVQREFVQEVVITEDEILAEAIKESGAVAQAEEKIEDASRKEVKDLSWKREFSVGYNLSKGNTEKSQLFTNLFFNRKTKKDEWTLRGRALYSSSDNKMDAQRYGGMARYAFNLGPSLKWYNFYRFEGYHDRFANIDYRLSPFLGFGYWFFDREGFQLMFEFGPGYEYTNYRDDTKSSKYAILVPRIFYKTPFIGKSSLSADVSAYFPPEDAESCRFRAEGTFDNPIDQYWSLRINIIEKFDQNPGSDTKKNDLSLISSLVYSF